MTTTHSAPSLYLVTEAPPRKDGWRSALILLATDGAERSDGAVRIAAARAAATGALLEVMVVLEVESQFATADGYFADVRTVNRRTARRRAVEAQLTRVLGPDHLLSVSMFDGNPAFTISRVAIERRASLIVVGIGAHLIVDRLFSDETALQLARIARVPVLAVPANTCIAPRHAVVAVDFSENSHRAAQSAVEAVSDAGHVDLVHVIQGRGGEEGNASTDASHAAWVDDQLIVAETQLVVPAGVTTARIVLHGRAAAELLAHATRVGADLLATGTHGRGFVSRAIVGSVTTSLLRGATCSLLSVPRDPVPVQAPSALETPRDAYESPLGWSRLLTDFTKRNAGRRTILEIDDLEIGAQAQEYNYPLLGASYSGRDGRFELMLGERIAGGRHLSRSISDVVAIDVLTDGAGADVALRVQHGTSQTLLTFAA